MNVFTLASVGIFHPSDYKEERPAMWMYINDGVEVLLIAFTSVGIIALYYAKEDITPSSYTRQSISYVLISFVILHTIWPCPWIMATILVNFLYELTFRMELKEVTATALIAYQMSEFIHGFLIVFFSYSINVLYAHDAKTDWCYEDNIDIINVTLISANMVGIIILSLLRRSPAYFGGCCFQIFITYGASLQLYYFHTCGENDADAKLYFVEWLLFGIFGLILSFFATYLMIPPILKFMKKDGHPENNVKSPILVDKNDGKPKLNWI